MLERVVVTTGGTGGHIFPALAVAEEIRRRHPVCEVVFIGGQYGREREFAENAGLEFIGLPVRGVIGRGLKAIGAVWGLGTSLIRAWSLLGRRRFDAVLGFGGYAGFAPVMAAALRKIPCAVHEQNSFPGSTNRLLSRWVDRVFLSFRDENGFFDQHKSVFTGNPVRSALRQIEPGPRPQGSRRVLVVGGSQGARAINDVVVQNLASLQEQGVELWHQTGAFDFDRVRSAYERLDWNGDSARVMPFIDAMDEAYAWADVVFCRAGATTVAELTVLGKPCVFVPFPLATHDHQTANARELEQAGAAILLPQSDLAQTDLPQVFENLFADPNRLQSMAEAARTLGRPEAVVKLVDEVEAMVE